MMNSSHSIGKTKYQLPDVSNTYNQLYRIYNTEMSFYAILKGLLFCETSTKIMIYVEDMKLNELLCMMSRFIQQ